MRIAHVSRDCLTMPPKGKQPDHSVLASLAAAAVTFLAVLVAVGATCLGIAVIVFPLFDGTDVPGWGTWVGIFAAAIIVYVTPIVTASYSSWRIYWEWRWRPVQPGGRYCVNCRYDLTGNVSGVCPECGEAVEVTE
jgi:hypothetical protein